MKPLVSVIIPSYDEGKYLENTLHAIENQNYTGNYEIIISDGGSKDNTLKIAKRHKTKIILNNRRGIAVGRNTGAKVAKGKILLFIDADTIAMPNLLTEFTKEFRNRKVVGVTCSVIPAKMNVQSLATYLSYNNISKLSMKGISPVVAGICVAYRAKDFFKIGGFDENLHTFEDLDISRRISKLGKIVFNLNTLSVTSTRRMDKFGSLKFFPGLMKLYLKFLTRRKIRIKEYRPVR